MLASALIIGGVMILLVIYDDHLNKNVLVTMLVPDEYHTAIVEDALARIGITTAFAKPCYLRLHDTALIPLTTLYKPFILPVE